MRSVILKMHVSLDGYARGAEGDVMDWIFDTYDDELQAWEVDMLRQAGLHTMDARCTRRWRHTGPPPPKSMHPR